MNFKSIYMGLSISLLSLFSIAQQKNFIKFHNADFSVDRQQAVPAAEQQSTWKGSGWKGEKINTQLLFRTAQDFAQVTVSASDLKGANKGVIPASAIQIAPLATVITDLPGDLKSGCGIPTGLDTAIVFDRILASNTFSYSKHTNQPIWLQIAIPADATPGRYKGTITVNSGDLKELLSYEVEVIDQVLPPAKDWAFHLDLWQNPFSIARYNQVKPWSQEHFDLLKPHIKQLADAGQKNITASIIYDPWNSQTYDIYESMIVWTKKKDGSWHFDYTNFDKWVEFMHAQGIDEFINCYSMIPWNLKFYYYDESTEKQEVMIAKPEDAAYVNHWKPFLKDFAQHLKQKGWFEKTTIAMDERPMKHMLAAIEIIKSVDENYQISLAGSYHKELAPLLSDYSITLAEDMPADVLAMRKAKGYKTTFYTCCTEIFPNTFTNSGYQEAVWYGWHAHQRGFDGYLRWAVDSWNKNPNVDARHGTWLAGDAYMLYPDLNSSIRFERLVEGVQDAEKIRIVRQQLQQQGRQAELAKLDATIAGFSNKGIVQRAIPKQLRDAKLVLNSFKK